MKKFKFTLQTLLDIRITEEKQQKAELARANNELNALLDGLNDIYRRFEAAKNEFNAKAAEGMPPSEFTAYQQGFIGFRDAIEEQKEKIRRAEEIRNSIRDALVETMKVRNTLEKLLEKQKQEYLEEAKKENEKVMDDYMSNKVAAV